MNMREFSPIFRKSGTIGIICELVGYGCVLACSLLLSDLLERAMAVQPIIGTGMLAAGCLLISCVLGCVLTVTAIACNKTISGKSYLAPLIPFSWNKCRRRFLRQRLKK